MATLVYRLALAPASMGDAAPFKGLPMDDMVTLWNAVGIMMALEDDDEDTLLTPVHHILMASTMCLHAAASLARKETDRTAPREATMSKEHPDRSDAL